MSADEDPGLSEWPPRWTRSHPKGAARTETKAAKTATRAGRVKKEKDQKAEVRKRDRFCRFPLCGCRALKLTLQARPEVSHDRHKGAGGDPSGERSKAAAMLLLCLHRHQDGPCSRHKGTLRSEPLDEKQGNDGPIRWMVHRDILQRLQVPAIRKLLRSRTAPEWFEVARENKAPQQWALNELQASICRQLAKMTL